MNLAGLLGAGAGELRERLGEPDAERRSGAERWLVYRRGGATLRVRCAEPGSGGAAPRERAGAPKTGSPPDGPGEPGAGEGAGRGAPGRREVASWTVTWERPRGTLRGAVEPLGLWPACAPDVDAASVEAPMVRRALPAGDGEGEHSLTAGVAEGGFVRVAAFDEPPEWT